jgi:hypothetical protein
MDYREGHHDGRLRLTTTVIISALIASHGYLAKCVVYLPVSKLETAAACCDAGLLLAGIWQCIMP